jgi:hypothetical protein
MRRPSTIVCSAALLAGTLLTGGAVAAAPPPDDSDDGSAAALEHFLDLADESGYTLVDPACSATSSTRSDLTYTCYAMTTQGGPFIARTTLSVSDVVEFTILAQPGQPIDVDTNAPSAEADAAEPVAFNALAYFDALFSGDATRVATLQSVTAPGSAAEAYALFQLEFAETVAESGAESSPSYVYATSDGVLICIDAGTCVMATDLEVINGQLFDFSIDGTEIAPRLGRPGQPITLGGSTAQARAAYNAVVGGNDSLRVYLELASAEPATFELSRAVYIDADGNLYPLNRETSVGATDVTVKGHASVALEFPGAMPGGEVRFVVYPGDDAAPLAAVIPIESFVGADDSAP